jgi:hypothetical protein
MMLGRNLWRYDEDRDPDYLPISPNSLRCPFCHAKANKVCQTASGGRLELVHVARIKAAAQMDGEARKARRKRLN